LANGNLEPYLQVQSTSFAPWAPPTQVAVLPCGQVTEQDCVLSALFAEQVFGGSSAATGNAPQASIITATLKENFKLRIL
jgi:hypothetical protein